MKILGWERDFEMGIGQFDENNKVIVVLLNKLLKIFYEETMNSDFHKVYATLLLYARKEFDAEESLMRKSRYEQAILHANQHTEFIKKMEYFADQYLNGEKPVMEFQKYAVKWADSHIKVTDKKFITAAKEFILNNYLENQ